MLRAGKVDEVIEGLKRLRPKTPESRQSLQALIRYYSENATRMHYDEYLRLGARRVCAKRECAGVRPGHAAC